MKRPGALQTLRGGGMRKIVLVVHLARKILCMAALLCARSFVSHVIQSAHVALLSFGCRCRCARLKSGNFTLSDPEIDDKALDRVALGLYLLFQLPFVR